MFAEDLWFLIGSYSVLLIEKFHLCKVDLDSRPIATRTRESALRRLSHMHERPNSVKTSRRMVNKSKHFVANLSKLGRLYNAIKTSEALDRDLTWVEAREAERSLSVSQEEDEYNSTSSDLSSGEETDDCDEKSETSDSDYNQEDSA